MTRLALFLCLLFCGCVRVPPKPPEPTPDATDMDRYFASFRQQIGIALGKTADGVDGLDEAVERSVQHRQPHRSDGLSLPHERQVGLRHVARIDDRRAEGLQQRTQRHEERMVVLHYADSFDTVTLTTVAPFA